MDENRKELFKTLLTKYGLTGNFQEKNGIFYSVLEYYPFAGTDISVMCFLGPDKLIVGVNTQYQYKYLKGMFHLTTDNSPGLSFSDAMDLCQKYNNLYMDKSFSEMIIDQRFGGFSISFKLPIRGDYELEDKLLTILDHSLKSDIVHDVFYNLTHDRFGNEREKTDSFDNFY